MLKITLIALGVMVSLSVQAMNESPQKSCRLNHALANEQHVYAQNIQPVLNQNNNLIQGDNSQLSSEESCSNYSSCSFDSYFDKEYLNNLSNNVEQNSAQSTFRN